MTIKRNYDSTVARVAGNIASGMMRDWLAWPAHDAATTCAVVVQRSVAMARYIVAETERTEIPNENAILPPADNGECRP